MTVTWRVLLSFLVACCLCSADAAGAPRNRVYESMSADVFSGNQTLGALTTPNLYNGVCPEQPISFGQTINGNLGGADCNDSNFFFDVFTFDLAPGHQIAVSVDSAAFDTQILLADESNQIIAGDDNGGGGTNSRIPATQGLVTIVQAGTYRIIVTSRLPGSTGQYSVSLLGGSFCPKTPLVAEQPLETSLGTDCLDPYGYYLDIFTFSGVANQQIALLMESTQFDPFLFLLDAEGNVLQGDDDGGGGTSSRIPGGNGYFTVPYSGVFHVLASSAFTFATGNYSLILNNKPAVIKADYRLQGNLNNEVADGPVLTELVGSGGATSFVNDNVDGYQRQTLRFPFNSGVAINSLGFPNAAATLVMLFKFDQVSGRRRLLDYTGGTAADNGEFLLDGRIDGENTANTPSLANTYVQLVVVRTGTGTVRLYRDGVLRVEFPDGGDPLAAGIRFFQDVINNPIEASPGNLARLRLYEGAMTPEQVQALDRVPESPFGEMLILLFSSRNGTFELYRMNADGTSHRRLTSNMSSDIAGKFSPDGTKIVYQRRAAPTEPYQVWVSNADGSNPVQLTNTVENNQSASWRPDGQRILFSRCASGRCDLYTMNPDGTQVETISAANTPGDEDEARFTPNGQKLVFKCSDTNGTNYQICVANADGSGRQAITNTAAPLINQQIDVSPDGQKIAFVRNSTTVAGIAGFDIYTANIDGSNVVNITNNATSDQNPIWSPDGTKIIFTAARAGGINDIWLMDANGSSAIRLMLNSFDDRVSDWYRNTAPRRAPFDFDGDGKTDISIFRPGVGEWWYLRSSDGGNRAFQFGAGTDVLVPADYTGDEKTDNAFYRNGEWFVQRSSDFSFYSFPFGTSTDIPAPADYDGDGKADAAVFRPENGVWFILRSSDGQVMIQGFGANGDQPVPADFDGDGKADIAIYRPSLGQWWIIRSTAGLIVHTFGGGSDKTVPGDYTGDGKADIAVFRPPTGEWFVLRSEDSSFYSFPFGIGTDLPAPGDYDGDGKTDPAVFRPSDTNWYVQRSTAGTLILQFGIAADKPIPGTYVR